MSMAKLAFLNSDSLHVTTRRFWPAVVCAWILFLLAIGAASGTDYPRWVHKLMIILAYGYFWFGAARIIADSRDWPVPKHALLAATGFILLSLIVIPAKKAELIHFLIVPALLLLIMVAPFVNRRRDDSAAFWDYNCRVWTGAGTAIIAALILWVGFCIAVGAFFYLFGIEWGPKVFFYGWLFCSIVLGPVYALAWIPRNFTSTECADAYPQSCKFLVDWITTPLICVYFVILYAYGVKVLIDWELPRGHLAAVISGFGAAGIANYMLAWPVRNSGNRLIQFLHRHFFKALLLPAIALFVAIFIRIEQYGVTEVRYLIVLAGVWFATVIALFVFRQDAPLKTVPSILAVLLVIASFGPWGAESVSRYSQASRLETLLVKYGLLSSGRIKAANMDVPYDDNLAIVSIVEYLLNSGKSDVLAQWFREPGIQLESKGAKTLTDQLGIRYIAKYEREQDERRISLSSPGRHDRRFFSVSGFEIVIQKHALNRTWTELFPGDAGGARSDILVSATGHVLNVAVTGHGELIFDLSGYVAGRLARGRAQRENDIEIVLDARSGDLRGQLRIDSISAEIMGAAPVITSVRFWLLLDIPN
jgi:Domain of unknown function (DUF4153)